MDFDNIAISNGKGWDKYILNHPRSFFYHLFSWKKAFEDVFGFKTFYLEAKRNEKICGVLPLVLVETFFEKKLVSIPIGVYAGVLSDDDIVKEKLVNKAIDLTKELGCSYLELRYTEKAHNNLLYKDLYATFIKELPQKPEECLSRMPRKARAAARHAVDNGLSYSVGLEYLDECYRIYAINQKSLGSPVVSKKWFEKLAIVFKDNTTILVVRNRKRRIIASVLTFFYKDTVLPFYGGCMPEALKLNTNNYMYLKLQEYSIEKGYRIFDFGRSRTNSGSYSFKVNQGFKPTSLYYGYYLNIAKRIPDISPSNKSFELARRFWKRLPLTLANWLGPRVFKYIIP